MLITWILSIIYSNLSMDSSKRHRHGTTLYPQFLLENGFTRGVIDKTLFHKMHKDEMILIQVYV